MRYSCGIIFYKDGQILVGHATGQHHWDIPKGKTENTETFAQAAVRECDEEIGFKVSEDNLLLLGEVSYRKGKRLVLFFYLSREVPDIDDCICKSTYVNKYGQEKPEFDDFKYIPVTECTKYLTVRMCKSICAAVELYKERNQKE